MLLNKANNLRTLYLRTNRASNAQSLRTGKLAFIDAMSNLLDGYKPVLVRGIDRSTGKKHILKDRRGLWLVNWVRKLKVGTQTVYDTLNHNGTKILETRNNATGETLEKKIVTKKKNILSVFKDKKMLSMNLTETIDNSLRRTFWWKLGSNSKLCKKSFTGSEIKNANRFGLENCPELSFWSSRSVQLDNLLDMEKSYIK